MGCFSQQTAKEKARIHWAAISDDIIECFCSQAHWFSATGYGLFKNIHNYPEMLNWLSTDSDLYTEQSNIAVWGYHLLKYEWKDLASWKDTQKTVPVASSSAADDAEAKPKKGKGKGKEKGKEKEKKSKSSHKKSKSHTSTK